MCTFSFLDEVKMRINNTYTGWWHMLLYCLFCY